MNCEAVVNRSQWHPKSNALANTLRFPHSGGLLKSCASAKGFRSSPLHHQRGLVPSMSPMSSGERGNQLL